MTKIVDATVDTTGVYEIDELHTSKYIAKIVKKLCQEW